MSKKLTIVVTCTDRKAVRPLPHHQVRNLPDLAAPARASAWQDMLSKAADTRPLRHLYRGEAWRQVERLESATRAKGLVPRVLVVSAGLGLRDVDSEAPAYSATFSTGHADSVGQTRAEAQAWWQELAKLPSALCTQEALEGPALLVLSEVYASAMAPALESMADRDDVILFGGKTGLLEGQRFPSRLGLRRELGGTAGSLNARMAVAWLERQGAGLDMRASRHRKDWDIWAASVESTIVYDRRSIDDTTLSAWIRASIAAHPGLTKSVGLRMLRDTGFACEQQRFGMHFAQIEEAG